MKVAIKKELTLIMKSSAKKRGRDLRSCTLIFGKKCAGSLKNAPPISLKSCPDIQKMAMIF